MKTHTVYEKTHFDERTIPVFEGIINLFKEYRISGDEAILILSTLEFRIRNHEI